MTENLNIFSSEFAEFPAFTICPDYDVSYDSEFLKSYKVTPNDVRKLNFPNWINISASTFFQKATHEMPEVIKSIEIEAKSKIPNTNYSEFYFVYQNEFVEKPHYMKIRPHLENVLLTKNYTMFGRCYSFLVPKDIRDLKVNLIAQCTLTVFSGTHCLEMTKLDSHTFLQKFRESNDFIK